LKRVTVRSHLKSGLSCGQIQTIVHFRLNIEFKGVHDFEGQPGPVQLIRIGRRQVQSGATLAHFGQGV